MVCRYFGLEEGGISYLLRNPTARVLKGNPDLSRLLAESIPSASGQRYTAGVLSETTDIPETMLKEAQMQTENQLLGGLPARSLDFLWVEHADKGKKEAHFIVPNLELLTGKRFSPYIDRIDRYRFRALMEKYNLEHGLHDQNSTIRVVTDYTKSRLSKGEQELLMEIWELVDAQVKTGTVTNRNDLVRFLREASFDLRDKTHAGKPLQQIAVRQKVAGVVRLKGSYYFRADFDANLLAATTMEVDPMVVQNRIQELKKIIRVGLEFRAYHSIGHLFGRTAQKSVKDGQAEVVLRQLIANAAKPFQRSKPAHTMFSDSGIQSAVLLMKTVEAITDPVLENQIRRKPTSGGQNQVTTTDISFDETDSGLSVQVPAVPAPEHAANRKRQLEEPFEPTPQPKANPSKLNQLFPTKKHTKSKTKRPKKSNQSGNEDETIR